MVKISDYKAPLKDSDSVLRANKMFEFAIQDFDSYKAIPNIHYKNAPMQLGCY